MHPKMKNVYVGVDIHRQSHTAVIINCFGEKLGEVTFDNKPSEFKPFLKKCKALCKKGIKPIFGLEDTNSSGRSLAVFLLSENQRVKKIDATLTYSERKNQSILHKTDSHDALCVSRVLLNKLDELPDADPRDVYWTLGMLVTRRNSIVKANTAIKNQLHANILYSYPSYRKFFSVFDCKTALAFWEKYPSPAELKNTNVEKLGEFLSVPSSGFFDHKKAKEILEFVENDGTIDSTHQETRDFIVITCVKEINHNHEEIEKIETHIKKLLKELDYKLESMIGIESVSAAGFISEIGYIGRFSSPHKLAKYAGISPVTYASGEKEKRFRNRNGNRRLYHLFHNLAARNINRGRNKTKPVNDIFYDYYQKKISEGKTEHQALISVMRRLVNIIYGLLKHKSEYKHPQIKRLNPENKNPVQTT